MSTSQCVEPMQEIRESTVLLRPGRQEGEISSKEEPRSVGIASPVARQVGSISPSGCVVHRSGRRMGKPLSREISFQYFRRTAGPTFRRNRPSVLYGPWSEHGPISSFHLLHLLVKHSGPSCLIGSLSHQTTKVLRDQTPSRPEQRYSRCR